MYSLPPGGKAVPMPQKSAVSASAGVELKLEPKDRLEYRAASTGNHLIFSVAWYKIDLETH